MLRRKRKHILTTIKSPYCFYSLSILFVPLFLQFYPIVHTFITIPYFFPIPYFVRLSILFITFIHTLFPIPYILSLIHTFLSPYFLSPYFYPYSIFVSLVHTFYPYSEHFIPCPSSYPLQKLPQKVIAAFII